MAPSPKLNALARPQLHVGARSLRATAARQAEASTAVAPAPAPRWSADRAVAGRRSSSCRRRTSTSADIGLHSRIEDALQVREAGAGRFALANAEGSTRTVGTELLARYHREGLHVTATHTFIRATEPDPDGAGRRDVPLTPRHALGVVGVWEAEGRGRVGMELYYTGRQTLDDNPFRNQSEPYLIVGALAEWRVRRARLFVNLENLTDTRQTRYDPLLLPARSPEGRWTTDVWAPLEGRVVNAGVRLEL